MSGQIYLQTLRRHWRGALLWAIGLGILANRTILLVPDVEALNQYAKVLETLPPAMLQMFGGVDLSAATPEGFLNLSYFSFLPLILALYLVPMGLNATLNEEEEGIMDVVMTLPIPRWRLLVERLAGYITLLLGMVAICHLMLMAGFRASPFEYNEAAVHAASLNILPASLFLLTLTIMLGTLLRRRPWVLSIIGVVVIGGYFIDVLGRAAATSAFNSLRVISFYAYYNSAEVFRSGLNMANVGVLLAFSALFVGVAVWGWQRRDIGL